MDEMNKFPDPRRSFTEQHQSTPKASASWSNGETKMSRPKRKYPSENTLTVPRRYLIIGIIGCLLVACLFGFAGVLAGKSLNENSGGSLPAESDNATIPGYTLEDATGSSMTIQEITAAAQRSVVEIRTESVTSDIWMQQYVTEGAGSGVIVSTDGYIATNNHVIEGADKIIVTTIDNREYEAKLVGTDSIHDIAVIKIKATGLSPAKYGNSSRLNVGDLAVAIGNPLGELGGTVTAGIISAKDRELVIDGKTMSLLQTDSSINPGNSGGGLFNDNAQLIGIVVAKSSGSDVEGLGFAIPINTAAEVINQLIDKGYTSGRPWTGMTYTEGSSGFDSIFGASSGSVYVYSVDTDVARRAGFKPGDIIFAVEDQQITSIDDLSAIVTAHEVGDKLKVTIVRDGRTKDITIKLQERKGE